MKIWQKIKPWLRGWRLVILIVVILAALIGRGIYQSRHDTSNILTGTVTKQDLKQTVLATGVVTSSTDLNLSFKASGTVRQIPVKIGQKVGAGQILATLDQKDQLATLTSARAALASAQANFKKIMAGASNEEVAVAQAAVDAAEKSLAITKSQQDVLVANAHSAFLNTGLAAIPKSFNISSVTVTVTGSYNSTQQGSYTLTAYDTGAGPYVNVGGLESGNFRIVTTAPVAAGTRGLFVQFSSTGVSAGDTWEISIPNTQASNYVSYNNSYQAALQTKTSAISAAQSTLDSAVATLNLKKALARPADIEAAQAQILSAQGQLAAANASLENTIVRAPLPGTVTKINARLGQPIAALAEAVVLQNIDQLHLEANVSEANIAQVALNQSVDVTFDSLGPDERYAAKLSSFDLSSTVVSGVVNYKVVATLDRIDNVRPGMTANMTILTNQKSGVLAIPQRAVLEHDNKKFVRVVTDSSNKRYAEQEVTVGISADGGLVEITHGLTEGLEIVTFINQK